MKREIKFRAWNNGEMLHNFWHDSKDGSIEAYNEDDMMLDTSNAVVMQFTSLKDKNGKEIYEGDVLHSAPEGHCEVRWDGFFGCWAAKFKEAECEELLGNSLKDYGLVVIGNVYENPDLLTKP